MKYRTLNIVNIGGAMKSFLLLFFILAGQFANAEVAGEYGVHLFFNEKEFIDVLTISKTTTDSLAGKMHVPNDFDGEITNVKLEELKLTFDLLVPKNPSRPADLVFRYHVTFFDESHQQFIGFVTIEDQPDFVASFVGFKRMRNE